MRKKIPTIYPFLKNLPEREYNILSNSFKPGSIRLKLLIYYRSADLYIPYEIFDKFPETIDERTLSAHERILLDQSIKYLSNHKIGSYDFVVTKINMLYDYRLVNEAEKAIYWNNKILEQPGKEREYLKLIDRQLSHLSNDDISVYFSEFDRLTELRQRILLKLQHQDELVYYSRYSVKLINEFFDHGLDPIKSRVMYLRKVAKRYKTYEDFDMHRLYLAISRRVHQMLGDIDKAADYQSSHLEWMSSNPSYIATNSVKFTRSVGSYIQFCTDNNLSLELKGLDRLITNLNTPQEEKFDIEMKLYRYNLQSGLILDVLAKTKYLLSKMLTLKDKIPEHTTSIYCYSMLTEPFIENQYPLYSNILNEFCYMTKISHIEELSSIAILSEVAMCYRNEAFFKFKKYLERASKQIPKGNRNQLLEYLFHFIKRLDGKNTIECLIWLLDRLKELKEKKHRSYIGLDLFTGWSTAYLKELRV